jgi:tripartite-type tricarboxylate transporter receptor subunit TctC
VRNWRWFDALALLLGLTQSVLAQGYPTHPVRILVQFPPGGVPDLSARLIAEQLSKAFGQSFIVENRPGNGGNLATDVVARSVPDGYTLLLSASAPLAISPAVYQKLPFDPINDFKPISLIASYDFVMMAAPVFSPTKVVEIVNLAKANPGKYNFASSGFGSEHHLSGELFNHAAGIHLIHVPYKGFGPATVDTMANQVELMFGAVPAAMPFIEGGKLRPIATTGTTRDSSLPDVPTFAEAGYPQVKVISWVGLLAPAGTPKPVYDKLVAESTKVIQSPEFVSRLKSFGLATMPVGPKPMAERIAADQKFWANVVKDSAIKQVN